MTWPPNLSPEDFSSNSDPSKTNINQGDFSQFTTVFASIVVNGLFIFMYFINLHYNRVAAIK